MIVRSHIIYSRLTAIVRELSETLLRTARSKGLSEARHFAVGALTGDARLAAQLQSDPSHSYLIRASVAGLLDYFAFDLADGDIVVVGDPYSGGSTPQVLTFAAPVLFDGEMVLFPAIRAELADLAGSFPGTIHPTATETWQESMRVTPVRLYRHRVLQRDVLRFLLRNSRAESLMRSDIEAIVSALRAAQANLVALLRDRGRAAVSEAIAAAIAHADRLTRNMLARWDGLDRSVSAVLPYDAAPPATINLRLRLGNEGLHADFAGTSPTIDAPYNMTLDHARGYVLVAALAELLDEFILNDGVLDAVSATAPQGSLLDPRLPAATGAADLVTGHVVGALTRQALFGDAKAAERLDGMGPALILFRPIGASEENPPYRLDPGFPISAQGWGAPVLSGWKLLPSAEILEARDGFELLARELAGDDGMTVAVRNRRGALAAAALVPGAEAGALTLLIDGQEIGLSRAAGAPVSDGAVLRFHYPCYVGQDP
jgi:N-methylhydantoinase B